MTKRLGIILLLVFCGTINLNAGLFRSIADYFTSTQRRSLGESLELEDGQYFSGKHVVEGEGNTITLLDGGELIVDKKSTLVLKNMTIKLVSQDNIKCVDDTGKIVLENVTFELDDTFFFDKGAIECTDGEFVVRAADGVVAGENSEYPTFLYKSKVESTIKNNVTWKFDRVWFFHVPYNEKSSFISFGGSNSKLIFQDCGIYVKDMEEFVKPAQVDCIGKVFLYKNTKDEFYEKYGVSKEAVFLTRTFTNSSFDTVYDVEDDEEHIKEE